ncbi:MAG: hypothetical protein FJ197_13305 [Gammaproteobacteria bacterium]|nr:hypothetical protein [Gammaproteobacteria bacterium]
MRIEKPGNHIDQLIRQTRWHHAQLSAMADTKANMMLTASAVVLTLALPRLADPAFRLAASILIVACLITLVLAALAAMPGQSAGSNSGGVNLLFFAEFSRMSYDEFERAMETTMNDADRTYEAQVREIYTLGRYLATRKYRYVRLAYMSFVGGLLISAAAYAIAL